MSSALRSVLKAASFAADRIVVPPDGITILIYHRVSDVATNQMTVTRQQFADQLQALKAHRLISLDDAVTELASGTNAGIEPGVVITFDDGTADWVDVVAPMLAEAGAPATFYVSTDFVDSQKPFPHDGTPLSWAGLAEVASVEGVTIGAHTHTHRLLDRLAPSEIADELDRCDELLAEHLSSPVEHFAYPKAVPPSEAAEREVKQRYRSAVLAGTHTNTAGADVYRLARSPIQPNDDAKFFAAKVAGGMGLEDRVRSGLNKARYRKLTS